MIKSHSGFGVINMEFTAQIDKT